MIYRIPITIPQPRIRSYSAAKELRQRVPVSVVRDRQRRMHHAIVYPQTAELHMSWSGEFRILDERADLPGHVLWASRT